MERLLGTVVLTAIIVILGLLVYAFMDYTSEAEGRVSDKYYDDKDLICTKGCVVSPECWTIVVGSEPWWNERACVSKQEYDSINIGDFFSESQDN